MKIVLSSGHGLKVRGASGFLDEVNEARRVVETVAKILRFRKIEVVTFHDDISETQDENLHRIVDFHNSQTRDLDCSTHFNAYEMTDKPMGSECCYLTQIELAAEVSKRIAKAAQLPDRGPKKRDDLYFLNHTEMPAILIETVFVDSETDADHYNNHFNGVCGAIAYAIGRRPEVA